MKRSAILSVRILGDAKSATAAMRETEKRTGLLTKGMGLLKGGAMVAGGVIAGTLGTALVKGWGRLTGIENAQAKLRGLGHDGGTVETIMGNALASVKGTSFGLDDAATTAAGAVASGIKPGAELERVLKSVTNSAAASGSSMGEMGAIYNKVAASNKAQNDVLSQVADRGIPIYQALAKQMGVTASEVFDMASRGKIDFATFEKAMTAASGTVAAELGNTATGALSNFGAALGRLGAGLLESFLPGITSGTKAATAGIDALGTVLGPVASLVGSAFSAGVERAVAALSGLGQSFAPVKTALDGIRSEAQLFKGDLYGLFAGGDLANIIITAFQLPVESTAANTLRTVQSTTALVIGEVIGGVQAFGAAWHYFDGEITSAGFPGWMEAAAFQIRTAWEQIKTTLTTVGTAFMAGLMPAMSGVTLSAGELVSGVVKLWQSFSPLSLILTAVQPMLPMLANAAGQLAGAFIKLLAGVMPLGLQLAGALVPAVLKVTGALIPVAQTILAAVIPAVIQLANAALPLVSAAVNAAIPLINMLASVLTGVVIPAVKAVLPIVIMFAQSLLNNVLGAVQGVTRFLNGLATTVRAIFAGDWSAAWNGAKEMVLGAVQAIWNLVQLWMVGKMVSAVKGGLTAVKGLFTSNWTGIKTFFTNIIRGIGDALRMGMTGMTNLAKGNLDKARLLFTMTWNVIKGIITSALRTIVSTVRGGLTGVGNLIKSVMTGAKNVVTGGWRLIRDAFSGGAGRVLGIVRGLPGKILGVFRNAGSLLKGAGRQMMQGMMSGIKGMAGKLASTAKGAVTGAVSGVKKFLGIRSPSRLFRTIGQQTMQGMEIGVAARKGAAVKAMTTVARAVSDAGSRTLHAPVAAVAPARTAAPAPAPQITINIEAGVGDPVEIGRQVEAALKRYRRAVGAIA